MVSGKSFLEMLAYGGLKKPLFSAPSSLPAALPQTVAVFRALLKLGVVVGGWGEERRRGPVSQPAPCSEREHETAPPQGQDH